MTERYNRSVGVSMSGIGLLISLTWFERSDEGEVELKATHLEYVDGGVMESVEKALNILAGDWQRFFIQQSRMHAISVIPNEDIELFDFIALAEQPEQAFISYYVLEYGEGRTAYNRIFDNRIKRIMAMRLDGAGA